MSAAERQYHVSTIVLGPVLLAQGLLARRRAQRLPEPPGPRDGVSGQGEPLRLLITGDSAAAGVGASHQDEALLGQVVAGISRVRRVEWTLRARTGVSTASTLAHLRKLRRRRYDVAVTSLGVNDVTSGLSRAGWRSQQRELRSLLKSEFGASHVITCGLPPVHGFPGLPQPLRWHLGRRAKQFSRDLQADVEADPGCYFLDLDFARDTSLMASDGFHPGPAIYAIWGRHVVDLVLGILGGGDLTQET